MFINVWISLATVSFSGGASLHGYSSCVKMAEQWFEPGRVVRPYDMFGEHKTEIDWWCTENEASANC